MEKKRMNKSWSCRYCNKEYVKSDSLYVHKKRKHPAEFAKEKSDSLDIVMQKKTLHSYFCPECPWSGPNKRLFNQHLRKTHKITILGDDSVEYECPECSAFFGTILALRQHYSDCHGKEIFEITFPDWKSFNKWKRKMEQENAIHFMKLRGDERRQSGDVIATFRCSNSGAHFPHIGTGKRPNRPSKKIGYICSVFMTVRHRTEWDILEVRFCLEHNHEMMPASLPLSTEDKESIGRLLKQGLSSKQVLHVMRHIRPLTTNDRLYYLLAKDINNIGASKKISGKVSAEIPNVEEIGASCSPQTRSPSPVLEIDLTDSLMAEHETLLADCAQLLQRVQRKLGNCSVDQLKALFETDPLRNIDDTVQDSVRDSDTQEKCRERSAAEV